MESEEEEWAARAPISSSSNSMTVGWTPMVERRRFMTWHMQQEGRLKMMTGFSEMRRWILTSADSAMSMASGEVVVGVSSRRTPPSANVDRKRRTPCIAGGRKEERKKERKKERRRWNWRGGEGGRYGFIYKKKKGLGSSSQCDCLHHNLLFFAFFFFTCFTSLTRNYITRAFMQLDAPPLIKISSFSYLPLLLMLSHSLSVSSNPFLLLPSLHFSSFIPNYFFISIPILTFS